MRTTPSSHRHPPRAHGVAAGPRVSVVIPVYNAEHCVARCTRSILEQSLADLECILVDDGSTDDTVAQLGVLARADSRVHIVRLRENAGIVPALQRGIAEARSDLIARMDADDKAHPERLRLQCGFLNRHPDIGLAGCRVSFDGNRGTQKGYALYVDWINGLLTPEQIALNRFVESPFAHPSVVFRRHVYEQFGGYREGPFPEDYELWLRWLDHGVAMAKLPETLLAWADPPGRLSRTDPRYSFDAFYRCKAVFLARWLAAHNPHHPRIVVWGAGRQTRKRADMLVEHGVRITHYVDIDPKKLGQTIHGRPVLSQEELPKPGEAFLVSYVASRGAREDIRNRLRGRGFREGRHFILAA